MIVLNEPALNQFLLNNALESESRGLCTTHLFFEQADETEETEVLGYFSLSTIPIDIEHLPAKLTKRYPHHVKPNLTTTLLARFALDKKHQGRKLGRLLLINMLTTTAISWKYVNSIGLLVHAKHQKAADFYKYYGFASLPHNELHLFMPRRTVLEHVKASQSVVCATA